MFNPDSHGSLLPPACYSASLRTLPHYNSQGPKQSQSPSPNCLSLRLFGARPSARLHVDDPTRLRLAVLPAVSPCNCNSFVLRQVFPADTPAWLLNHDVHPRPAGRSVFYAGSFSSLVVDLFCSRGDRACKDVLRAIRTDVLLVLENTAHKQGGRSVSGRGGNSRWRRGGRWGRRAPGSRKAARKIISLPAHRH